MRNQLLRIYDHLFKFFGPRHWWPAKTPFEVMVGAVLTQAVAWRNVQKAIVNLENAGLMEPLAIYWAETYYLEELVKPTRYYRVKTKKLQALVKFVVEEYRGDLEFMFHEDLTVLRNKFLDVYGLGPETVDSILLYAGQMPVFVVDQYTRRIFSRLGLVEERITYAKLQALFTAHLPQEVELYNEFHALIDGLGNRLCHNNPICIKCPLAELCRYNLNQRGPS
jgi:endonuclease III related protein